MRARLFACALVLLVSACTSNSSIETATAPSPVKCAITLQNSMTGAAPAAGASGTLSVTTTRDCTWTATSDATWLTIASGANGQGDGSVAYGVAANGQPSQRRGTLAVNGQQTTVTQDAASCRYNVTPANSTVSMQGGTVTVNVEALSGCAWTAQSSSSWMSIASGAAGDGNGAVRVQVGANGGDGRSGTITVAGNTVTVNQGEAPCAFGVAPASMNLPFGSGGATATVTVRAGCAWTASSGASWIAVASGASGSGNGTVALQIAANDGDARSSSIKVAGTTVAIAQAAAPCTFGISPLSQSAPVEGAGGSATVTVRAGCTWTAVSNVPWITITSGSGGNGGGSVAFSIASNPGPPRTGTLTIANMTFTVNQATVPCDYGIVPWQQFIGGGGGLGQSFITTGPTCPWTAVPNVPWITMIGAASGIANGRVEFAIGVNTGAERIGTISITGGQTFTVHQGAAVPR